MWTALSIADVNDLIPTFTKICNMVMHAFVVQAERDPVICYWRVGDIGGGSKCNTMPPNSLEGDFLLVSFLLFVGLPALRGDALCGGPFLLWQVASLSTSPLLDTAAPEVDVLPPFALNGASPSLHAQHEEQCFLFLLKSFKWMHWRHGQGKARRVADCSSGISLREAEKEIGRVAAGLAYKLRQEDHAIPINRAYMHSLCR